MFAALRDADMPPPLFDDDGLRFTVVLRRDQSAKTPLVRPGTTTAKVLAALGAGPLDVEQIATATALEPANIRRRLRELRTAGLVLQHGGRGLPHHLRAGFVVIGGADEEEEEERRAIFMGPDLPYSSATASSRHS